MKNLIYLFLLFSLIAVSCSRDESINIDSRASDGKSGSTASMITYGSYIYVLDNEILIVINASDVFNPTEVNRVAVGEGVETLFAYDNKLYMGTRTGLLIYALTNPAAPSFLGTNRHIEAKDPVVIDGTIGYLTIRQGEETVNPFGWLEVINVSNPFNSVTINTLSQPYPVGLAVHKDVLYVCNGIFGLNVFSVENPIEPIFLENYYDEAIYDCIPVDNLLICQSKKGLVLYDISTPEIPVFIKLIEK